MTALGRMLAAAFKAPAQRKPADPAYAQFRALVRAAGLSYRISGSDGFIELSNGRCFPYYGDWSEAVDRFNNPQADA